MKLTIEKCWTWSDWPMHWGLSPQACLYVPIKAASPTVKCCMSLAGIYVVIFRLGQQQLPSGARPKHQWLSLSNLHDEVPSDWLHFPGNALCSHFGPTQHNRHPINHDCQVEKKKHQKAFWRASAYKLCVQEIFILILQGSSLAGGK